MLGYHIIMTAYGWWLPNDPRGCTSRTIASDLVAQLGELHYGRKKLQPPSREIHAFYSKARHVLQHDLLDFDHGERDVIAAGFAQCLSERRYTCYAAAIMPEHIHLLIRKHRDRAEEMIAQFQSHSAALLKRHKLRPLDHPVWAAGGWKVFLNTPEDIHRTIPYIERNPLPLHRPAQRWDWITPYDGWPRRKGQSVVPRVMPSDNLL